MNIIKTEIPEVLIIEPKVFGDARGFFFESYNQNAMAEAGITVAFVQDNHSRSAKNRAARIALPDPAAAGQAGARGGRRGVRRCAGRAQEFAHLRPMVGFNLSAENKRMAWIPPGFAHGFLVVSDYAEFLYKTTEFWAPQHERCIRWDDPDLGIAWPLQGEPLLAAKDSAGLQLKDAEVFP